MSISIPTRYNLLTYKCPQIMAIYLWFNFYCEDSSMNTIWKRAITEIETSIIHYIKSRSGDSMIEEHETIFHFFYIHFTYFFIYILMYITCFSEWKTINTRKISAKKATNKKKTTAKYRLCYDIDIYCFCCMKWTH